MERFRSQCAGTVGSSVPTRRAAPALRSNVVRRARRGCRRAGRGGALVAGGGAPYRLAAGDIPVAAGETARTLSPPGGSPVAAIEPNGFVRELNATAAGDSARAAINVSALAVGVNTTLPSDARVAIITSFAAVWLPPDANATGVPADGLIELYVSPRAPDARDIAGAFSVDARDVLEVRRVVEAGDDAARIEFSLPVRMLLAGQANGSAFYAGADGTVVPIVAMCGADDADAVHAQLGGAGACWIESGSGMAIYTYHLTRFGTAVVDRGHTCSASLSPPEVQFDRVEAGGRSGAAAQVVRGTGTLPLALVSVSADGAWTSPGGAEMMPANATSARAAAGGDWTPLGGGVAVDVPADGGGESASVEFRLDVPQGALEAGARDAMVSQAVTYTVTCAAPPG